MTKISRMSYMNLGYMIDSAVGAGIMDRSSGRAHLPDPFLFKMQSLAEQYREQRTLYARLTGETEILREKRNQLSPMLAQLVRNIHTSFNRFFKLGKVSKADMSAFQIPRQASSHPANRLKAWITFASTITRVYEKHQLEGHPPLPAYVLTDATVTILKDQLSQAEAAQSALKRKVFHRKEQHIQLLKLRQQVVQTLELVKRHLELSLYGKSSTVRRQAMASYGMLLPDRKGMSQMLAPDMVPPTQEKSTAPAEVSSPPPSPASQTPKVTREPMAEPLKVEPEEDHPPLKVTDTELKAAITVEEKSQRKANNWDKIRDAAKRRKAAMAQNPKQRKKRPSKSKKHK